jgi:outer membrane receptor protein involved in Fe transport
VGFGPGPVSPCGFVPGGGSCRQRQNLDKSRIQGLEAEIDYRPSRRFRLSGSYLYSDAEITEASSQIALEGKKIAQVPEHQLVGTGAWSASNGLELSLQGRWVDEQFDDDLNTRVLDSFITFDLTLNYPVDDRWTVFLRGQNLFDEEIEVAQTADGLITTGTPFLFHGGFRLRFRG